MMTLKLTFISQLLQVINPSIKYAPDPSMPDSKIDGIAIDLKEFLTALNSRGISHPSEKSIRKKLRANNHCSTHHKQYFLKQHPGNMPLITKAKVARSDHGLSRHKSCVCLPKSFIPDSFFEAVLAKGILFSVLY